MPRKKEIIEKFLACPACYGRVTANPKNLICLRCGKKYFFLDRDIPQMLLPMTSESKLSIEKWDAIYTDREFLRRSEKEYKQYFLDDIKRQVIEFTKKNGKKKVYLEIGCGQGFQGEALAKEGWFFIGVDFSENALRQLKRRLKKRGITNVLLIQADIKSLPIRDKTVDLAYGGGVIEHFKSTQVVINHLYRVLKNGGIVFNSVPYFSLGNLIYRSRWGSIPNVPVLRQLFEFVNIDLLRAKHMVFGYELQFTGRQLFDMHKKAGFSEKRIWVRRFDIYIQLHTIHNQLLRRLITTICSRSQLFWPAVKVIAAR